MASVRPPGEGQPGEGRLVKPPVHRSCCQLLCCRMFSEGFRRPHPATHASCIRSNPGFASSATGKSESAILADFAPCSSRQENSAGRGYLSSLCVNVIVGVYLFSTCLRRPGRNLRVPLSTIWRSFSVRGSSAVSFPTLISLARGVSGLLAGPPRGFPARDCWVRLLRMSGRRSQRRPFLRAGDPPVKILRSPTLTRGRPSLVAKRWPQVTGLASYPSGCHFLTVRRSGFPSA
jgi:hypothetical protein